MADFNTTREAQGKTDARKDILSRARKDWDAAEQRERHNIKLAYEDLEFLAGDELSQWPEKQKKEREDEGRPTLQINQLPQFVHQITGDIRQMKPSIKVVPVDSQADEKVADLRGGLIRYIENRSDASAIYFRSADSQVACGIGHWRVATEYADSSTFNQEIRIAPIEDGIAVLWDPDAVLPTREDGRFCFVPVDMSKNAFEAAYPGITASEFDDQNWSHNTSWYSDDHVRVAEYWVKKPTKKLLALQLDGAIADVTDAEESVVQMYRSKGARIEQRDSTKVCRYLITASAVLEGPEEWPGRFIPIVPLVGEEVRIGRKLIRKGIVRDAKDPQRMSNYFHSAHTEVVALQPKAPFTGTELNFAKYQSIWETANTKNQPYLPYIPDPTNGGASPQRVQPPVSSQGVLDGLTMAKEDLRSVIGIYDAGLGKQSNETSGRAILARQKEGDVGSYLYIDNFARAVRQTGNIINDLIPHVYDTERTIRIMGEDGKIDVLEINKAQGLDPKSGETIFEHDITAGSYDVVATLGPSYTTKREEAKEGMTEFVRAAPEAGALVLDYLAKAQDWPMADDIAKRFRSMLPPKIIQLEAMEKAGATPEQIDQFLTQQQAPPPDPKMLQVQATAENNQAKLAAQQQQAMADFQLEMRRMAMEAEQRQNEQTAAIQKMLLEAQTKIEIAQITAGVGIHKNILDATKANNQLTLDAHNTHQDRITDAALTVHDIDSTAEPSEGAEPEPEKPDPMAEAMTMMAEAMQVLSQTAQSIDRTAQALTAPKKVTAPGGRVFTISQANGHLQ